MSNYTHHLMRSQVPLGVLVSPPLVSVPGTHSCIVNSGMKMSHGSLALVTCGEPSPGLAGSHFLNETQMQRFSAGDGTEDGHAQSLTEVNEQFPNYSNSGPSSEKVSSCQNSVIRCPMPEEGNGVQESRGVSTRICAGTRPAC